MRLGEAGSIPSLDLREVFPMSIIVSINDYRKCIHQIPAKGKWQAWLDHYYSKYRDMFDVIFKFLYMADVQVMKGPVEACNFEQTLGMFEKFLAQDGVRKAGEILALSEDFLAYRSEFQSDYDVFAMAGVGQIGGTAPPSLNPFIYLGAEVIEADAGKLNFLVSHEFHHLARNQMRGLEVLVPATYTFAELILTEGLATAFSIVVQGLDFDTSTLKTALYMTEEALSYCIANRDAIIQEILSFGESPVTQELMIKYLYSGPAVDSQGRPGNAGYYAGTAIVSDLLDQGYDMRRLTKMSGQDIIQLWKSCS